MAFLDALAPLVSRGVAGSLTGQALGEQLRMKAEELEANRRFREEQNRLMNAIRSRQLDLMSTREKSKAQASNKKLLVPYVSNLQRMLDNSEERYELERQGLVGAVTQEIADAIGYITDPDATLAFSPKFQNAFQKVANRHQEPEAQPEVPTLTPKEPTGMFGGAISPTPSIPSLADYQDVISGPKVTGKQRPAPTPLLPGVTGLERGLVSAPATEVPRLRRKTEVTDPIAAPTTPEPIVPVRVAERQARTARLLGQESRESEAEPERRAGVRARTTLATEQAATSKATREMMDRKQEEIENARKARDHQWKLDYDLSKRDKESQIRYRDRMATIQEGELTLEREMQPYKLWQTYEETLEIQDKIARAVNSLDDRQKALLKDVGPIVIPQVVDGKATGFWVPNWVSVRTHDKVLGTNYEAAVKAAEQGPLGSIKKLPETTPGIIPAGAQGVRTEAPGTTKTTTRFRLPAPSVPGPPILPSARGVRTNIPLTGQAALRALGANKREVDFIAQRRDKGEFEAWEKTLKTPAEKQRARNILRNLPPKSR